MSMKKIIALLLAGALIAGFSGCTTEEAKSLDVVDVPKATVQTVDTAYANIADESVSSYIELEQGDSVELELAQRTAVNTVTLREKGTNCEGFEIYGEDAAGSRTLLYSGDVIDEYLYCAFPEQEVTRLLFTVTRAAAPVKLCDLSAYGVEKQAREDYRVHAYYAFWGDDSTYFTNEEAREDISRQFDVVTDAFIIGNIYWNEDGTLKYSAENLKKELAALREIIGDRDVRVWACILNPRDAEGVIDNDASVRSIRNHLDTLTDNIVAFCEEYGFDGVDFDWEYPRMPHVWKAYDKLLLNIDPKLEEKGLMLASALGPWGNMMSQDAKETLDYVNVMAYDWAKNDRYNHSEFYSCHYFSAEYFLNRGFTKDQLVLGVPFYGNVTSEEYATYSYSGFDITDRGQNTAEVDGKMYYFNGYNMIYSKTAFSIDQDFAGTMVWSGQLDKPQGSEYSLLSAIGAAMNDRFGA